MDGFFVALFVRKIQLPNKFEAGSSHLEDQLPQQQESLQVAPTFAKALEGQNLSKLRRRKLKRQRKKLRQDAAGACCTG